MQNFVQRGDVLPLTTPTAVEAGGVVIVGGFTGIAATNASAGGAVECALVGVFTVPKKVGESFSQGDALFWDAAAAMATLTQEGNTRLGTAASAALASAALASAPTADVRLAN